MKKFEIIWENAWVDGICSCGTKIRLYYSSFNKCAGCGQRYKLDASFKVRKVKKKEPWGI